MKKAQLWDIVFLNLTATLGIRAIPLAAQHGASAIVLWLLAALLFFLPLGFVSTEFAIMSPGQGGMYEWIKKGFGEKCAFEMSWLYWTKNFFYCPTLLTFMAITVAFIIHPTLVHQKVFVCTTILITLWGVTFLHLRESTVLRWLIRFSGTLGNLLPGLIIVFLGFAYAFIGNHPIPTDYSAAHWLPDFSSSSNMLFIVMLMFSMSGVEVTPILTKQVDHPKRTFTAAILISAVLIVGLYIISTLAMTLILSPHQIQSAHGLMSVIDVIARDFQMPFLGGLIALMILLGSLGGLSIWTFAPVKMFLESTQKGILPATVTQCNKHDIPSRALFIQAGAISLITVSTAFLPSMTVFYETLLLMTTVISFIPYLLMFCSFLKTRIHSTESENLQRIIKNKGLALMIGGMGLFSVLIAILLPLFIPSHELKTAGEILFYRTELIGGTLLFLMMGHLMYVRYERQLKKQLLTAVN